MANETKEMMFRKLVVGEKDLSYPSMKIMKKLELTCVIVFSNYFLGYFKIICTF